MKLGSACSQCRNGKRKCHKSAPGAACDQCSKRHLNCSSLSRHKSSPAKLLPQYSPTENETIFPSMEVREELVDLYICYIHDKPHTLFHEPSLRQAARDGSLSHPVLFGIAGLSARFSSSARLRSRGHVFASEAKRLVKDDLENICLEIVQACILVGNICLAESNADTESLYFVVANRMAQLLKLAHEKPGDDSVLCEVKRRVWWSLYMIDRWASAGLGLSRQFHAEGLAPRLPMDEVAFRSLEVGNLDYVEGYRPGLWAHMLTLVKIFGHIQDLNKELADKDWDEEYIESSVLFLSQELMAFDRDLPPTIVYTIENLALQVQRGVGRAFVALHLGYHHYATLLYYQYLDQYRPDTPNRRMYVQRCKYHATSFCELLKTSEQYGAEAFHAVVGHMTIVSSSVLLHTLLLGDDEELPMARERLESNFKYLVKLRGLWPNVGLMMNRLITFQNACLQTTRIGTHRFDKWMVKFLLQHALALDEHDAYRLLAESPSSSAPVEDQRLLERSRVTEKIIRPPP